MEPADRSRSVLRLIPFKPVSLVSALVFGFTFLGAFPSNALYLVTIDTSALSRPPTAHDALIFDFIDGGSPSNTVSISGFASDATLGAVSTQGDVAGTLADTVTMTDTSFFNEYFARLTLGNTISFYLNATANAPDAASIPDALSIFLFDNGEGRVMFPTTDPTGANALLLFEIDGSDQGTMSVYSAPGGEAIVTAVGAPEPSSLLLVGLGASALLRRRLRRREE
jgi:hypothetical protein